MIVKPILHVVDAAGGADAGPLGGQPRLVGPVGEDEDRIVTRISCEPFEIEREALRHREGAAELRGLVVHPLARAGVEVEGGGGLARHQGHAEHGERARGLVGDIGVDQPQQAAADKQAAGEEGGFMATVNSIIDTVVEMVSGLF